jgi:hypothetical protein
LRKFQGQRAQLVVCDGAPDVTGFHDIDQYVQSQLLVAALNIAIHVLQKGGTFVGKVFKGEDTQLLYSQFKLFFKKVCIYKPDSSRQTSVENFIVCQYFQVPENMDISKFTLTTFQTEKQKAVDYEYKVEKEGEKKVPQGGQKSQEKPQKSKQLSESNPYARMSGQYLKMFKFVTTGDLSGWDQPLSKPETSEKST